MDDSIYYSLQNENIAKDAEVTALKRKIDDLKQEVGSKNGLPFQYPNVGDRAWYLFPLWDFGLRRVVWEMAGDHKFFADREGICILYWVNKNGVARFNAVKSEYVFEEPEYAERAAMSSTGGTKRKLTTSSRAWSARNIISRGRKCDVRLLQNA